MPDFVPGLALCERFYREVVAPVLARDYPALPHSAAVIGPRKAGTATGLG